MIYKTRKVNSYYSDNKLFEYITLINSNSSFVLLIFCISFISCQQANNKNDTLEFQPVKNKIYTYAFVKTSVRQWVYDSVNYRTPDTVTFNFSMQHIDDSANISINRFTVNSFRWKDKVNYKRTTAHAKPIMVLMNDSGAVEKVEGINKLLMDVKMDSGTGKYLDGLIPDYISENGIKDLLNSIFIIVPALPVQVKNTWVKNITTVTKAPIHFSNLYTMNNQDGDTAFIDIQSIISATQSVAQEAYMKGTLEGRAAISYATGMPFSCETTATVVTSHHCL